MSWILIVPVFRGERRSSELCWQVKYICRQHLVHVSSSNVTVTYCDLQVLSRGWSQASEDYATAWVQLSTDLSFFSLMWNSTPWTPSRGTSTLTRCLCTAPLRYQLQLSTRQLMCSPVPAAFNVIFRLFLLPSPFSKLKLYFSSSWNLLHLFLSLLVNFFCAEDEEWNL